MRATFAPLTREATLVVLAGGRSTRMGRSKAELPVEGTTLLEWIVRRLGPSFAETLVAGAAAPAGARAVTDRVTDGGPLAGVVSALAAARTPHVFVLACDVPRASARLASLLLERAAGHGAAVPRVGGRVQPACAVYAAASAAAIARLFDGGERRLLRALDVIDVRFVGEDELAAYGVAAGELADLDTPADYEAFLASLRP